MRRECRPDLTASERTLSGARLTTISVAAGVLATLASLFGVAFVAAVGSATTRREHRAALASRSADRSVAVVNRLDDGPGETSLAVQERHFGYLTLVDIGAQIGSLDDELARQRTFAAAEHERFLVWLVVDDCKPCSAVEAALKSPQVQRALGSIRIVRLNAVEFLAELSRLGVPMNAFPAFVLLGPDGHALDYVHGGEWEDDTPGNIAPVLKSFVDGTYVHRRSPWHGGLHEDETPI